MAIRRTVYRHGATQVVTSKYFTSNTTAFQAGTNVVRVQGNHEMSLAFGSSPTATTSAETCSGTARVFRGDTWTESSGNQNNDKRELVCNGGFLKWHYQLPDPLTRCESPRHG